MALKKEKFYGAEDVGIPLFSRYRAPIALKIKKFQWCSKYRNAMVLKIWEAHGAEDVGKPWCSR